MFLIKLNIKLLTTKPREQRGSIDNLARLGAHLFRESKQRSHYIAQVRQIVLKRHNGRIYAVSFTVLIPLATEIGL